MTTATVAQDQRARLLSAIADVVADRGYAAATVADVVRAAGVSRSTFYEQFASKEECFLEAYRAGVERLLEEVRAAVHATAGRAGATQLRAGVRAYLAALGAEPRFARTYLLEIHAAGPAALDARAEAGRRFADRYRATSRAGPRRRPRAARAPPRRAARPLLGHRAAVRRARARHDLPARRPRGRLLQDAPNRCCCTTTRRSPDMDLTFNDQETAFRDELRAWLADNPAGRRARAGEDAELRLAARLAAPAARGRLGRRALADRVRRPRRLAHGDRDLLRGDGQGRRAAAGERPRPAARRAHDHDLGHRRAEGALPRADPLGRRDLVPGLLRARRRVGPRGAEDARGQGRRRLGRHRAEGLDLGRAVLEVVHARRAHRPGRAEAQGAHLLPHGHGAGRRAGAPAHPDHRRSRSSTSSSSRRRGSPTRTSSAGSATAGRSR